MANRFESLVASALDLTFLTQIRAECEHFHALSKVTSWPSALASYGCPPDSSQANSEANTVLDQVTGFRYRAEQPEPIPRKLLTMQWKRPSIHFFIESKF